MNRDKQIHHLMQAEADLTAHRLLEVEICPLTQSQLKHQNQPDQSLQVLCKCCTTILLCSPYFLFCHLKQGGKVLFDLMFMVIV